MHKIIFGLTLALFVLTAADTKRTGSYVTNSEIQDAFKKSIARGAGGNNVLVTDIGIADVMVGVDFVKHDETPGVRPASKGLLASEHDKVTEIYHIMEGSGTLVTGGTIPGSQRDSPGKAPNGPTTRGSSIQNGVSRKVGPGDVVVIPAGVPHWFSAVDEDLKFLIVRVGADKVLRAP